MPTILVVDDSGVDRVLVGGFVRKAGCEVKFAENGALALEQIGHECPDVVLTDMQMPEIDGLELVKRMRRDHPSIPVILMTAFGAEDIAVKALEAGAVSYVAKKNLKDELGEALRSVMATVAARDERRQVRRLLVCQESVFQLGYESGGQSLLVNHLQDDLARMEFGDEGGRMQIGMALSEALTNAIEHGNLELDSALREEPTNVYRELGDQRTAEAPYCDRRVHVTQRITHLDVTYVIRDEGPGFDPGQLPDPTDPENLLKASGRGIMLIKTFMDDVSFSSKGNEIKMVKRRPSKD